MRLVKESRNDRLIPWLHLGAWLVLSLVLFACHQKVMISSDTSTTVPMAYDMLKGNVFLGGWVLGTNNFFFTETIFLALLRLFGSTPLLSLQILGSVFWAALICGGSYLFFWYDRAETAWGEKVFLSTLWTVGLGIVTPASSYTLLNINSHNALYFWIVLAFGAALLYQKTGQKRCLAVFLLLAMLSEYSESVSTMVLFAPLGALCLWQFITAREKKRWGFLLLGVTGGFALGKLLGIVIVRAGGMVTRGIPLQLVLNPSAVWHRAIGFVEQARVLFGGPYLKQINGLNAASFYQVLMLLWGAIFVAALFHCLVTFKKRSPVEQLLFLVTAINICGCLFTDVVVFHRYIVPAYVFGSGLAVLRTSEVTIWLLDRKKRAGQACVCIVMAALVFVTAVKATELARLPVFGGEQREVARLIREKGYGDGYGSFWCSSQISSFSDYQTAIYPIFLHGNGIQPYNELIKTSWYKETDKHFIIMESQSENNFVDRGAMLSLLGEPDDSFVSGGYQVYYWEKDISAFLVP